MELISVKSKIKKRIGRGLSSGQGKTAGRGTKGQRSRSGFNLPKRFEGGQTPLGMRLPKLPGFKSHKPKATVITLDDISKAYKDGETVTFTSLFEKGLITDSDRRVKILNDGALTVAVTIEEGMPISAKAEEAIKSFKKSVKAEKTEEAKAATEEKAAKPAAEKAPAKKPSAKKATK